ncbi:Uncharacterised protein [Achromobacter xylosoxidans]|nr:Uncharacterised protein [Achromobacter xylosoxidans]
MALMRSPTLLAFKPLIVYLVLAVDSKPISATLTIPSWPLRVFARFLSASMVSCMRVRPLVPEASDILPDVSTTIAML